MFYDLPVTFDARQAAAMTMPRGLRLPARLLLSALVGRVRIPAPITARSSVEDLRPAVPILVESEVSRPRRVHAA